MKNKATANFRVRKCRNCKEKFIPKSFKQKFCLKDDCIKAMLGEIRKSQWKEQKKSMVVKVKVPELKEVLKTEINKLARIIDRMFGYKTCIDCGKGFGKQIDGAHFHSRGAKSSLRYNLHNIHSASSQCNQFSENHKSGYIQGIKSRYGEDYFSYINDLPVMYPNIKLTGAELMEKIKITRKLIRDIESGELTFKSSLEARGKCNSIIGIYT